MVWIPIHSQLCYKCLMEMKIANPSDKYSKAKYSPLCKNKDALISFLPWNGNILVYAEGILGRTLFNLCQTNVNINKHKHNGIKLLTSSGVSLVSGWPWAARRAMAPARILLRLIWRSGGGPPRGWPRTMMAQPDKTWTDDDKTH